MHDLTMPRFMATEGPLFELERLLSTKVIEIESWFRQEWKKTPAPLYFSVDLRDSGFKLAPVDANLFPAGFNNLNEDSMPLCIQALQAFFFDALPECKRIAIIPEDHTRNEFYLQSLSVLEEIFLKAGFKTSIASLDPNLTEPVNRTLKNGKNLLIHPLERQGTRLKVGVHYPCLFVLNNDLSTGVPAILQGIEQKLIPSPQLGWASRLKSKHFEFYQDVSFEFSKLLNLDPWLINPYFSAVTDIDFMEQKGMDRLADEADKLLSLIEKKYQDYGLKQKPFIAVKADNGTYGMGVMMVKEGQELKQLNRKQRTKMASSKGAKSVDKVILQEGIYSVETMPNGAVAEPVVYMLGPFVVGGFYRIHEGKHPDENLNAPGMYFHSLAFAKPCNLPCEHCSCNDPLNRFYAYGVIARLSALAAGREIMAKTSSPP